MTVRAGSAAVRAEGIDKSFGGVRALRGASLTVAAGEIHVLAGANGAGKSTLVRILGGATRPDRGMLWLRGREARFSGPDAAIAAGVAVVHQELSLIGPMSIADNLFLGREVLTRWRTVDASAQARRAEAALAAVFGDADPLPDVDAPVESLPLATAQLVEIARALSRRADVLVLDEPTSALGAPDVARLFARVRRLAARGVAVIFITHRMEEMFELGDRATVLADGRTVRTFELARTREDALVRAMLGDGPTREPSRREAAPRADGGARLVVSGLGVRAPVGHGASIEDVDLTARAGEVLGLAGLAGAGVSLLLRALVGAEPLVRGTLSVDGEPFAPASPRDALLRGVVLLPADRKAQGLCLQRPVLENATLSSLPRWSPGGWLRRRLERDAIAPEARRFDLRASSLDAAVSTLSGGNQQKVGVVRARLARPAVLLLDEPTRGVDITAKADIHRALRGWASEGAAVVMTSSELPELLAVCDRIVVLARGRVTAAMRAGEATREAILAAAMAAPAVSGAVEGGAEGRT